MEEMMFALCICLMVHACMVVYAAKMIADAITRKKWNN
jgi:hypothetical protein